MNIAFYVKSVFGKEYYYPASEEAKVICSLLKTPTLTLKHLRICKDAGWSVEQVESRNDELKIII